MRVQRGARVVEIDGDEPSATLATGEIIRGDVLVAADGLWGLGRQVLLEQIGDIQEEKSYGLMMYT